VLEKLEAAGDSLSLVCRLIAVAICRVRNDYGIERHLALQKDKMKAGMLV